MTQIKIDVTIDLSEKTINVLRQLFGGTGVPTPQPKEQQDEEQPTATVETATPVGEKITMEDMRALINVKNQAGKRADMKALISKLGYDKFAEVPAEKYPELKAQMEKL